MLTVAYLANEFPSPVEPYVGAEIEELRRQGVRVVAGSVRKRKGGRSRREESPEIVLQAANAMVSVRAAYLCVRNWNRIAPLLRRVIAGGSEGVITRLKALAHTFLGGCYAAILKGRGVEHIHVHHGYFGSWIAMTAARLLDVGFSMTLHGSDLLLHGTYLDVKLAECKFCLTVSEYNRRFILERYPEVASGKVSVVRMGVDLPNDTASYAMRTRSETKPLEMLAVGRLQPVKDHAFLVRACGEMAEREVHFECLIAGEGPERRRLEDLIRQCGLREQVKLLGHVEGHRLNKLYEHADVVVLTSRSEGIPLVLMEAMARRKLVLAPAITGIPELVIPGKTGFLYEPGSMGGFVDRIMFLQALIRAERRTDQQPDDHLRSAARQLHWVRNAARLQVLHNFNRTKNLEFFADLFLHRVAAQGEKVANENFVLQQI